MFSSFILPPSALKKVWRDLWNHTAHTLLVVLSISVGVLAVGMILAGNTIITRQTTLSQKASHPSHARIMLNEPVGDDVVSNLARLPGVDQLDGWTQAGARWRPAGATEWQDAQLFAIDDYEHQKFNLITLRSGQWPDSKSAAVEFNHVVPHGVPPVGGKIEIEIEERVEALTIGGTVRDPIEQPPPLIGFTALYVTRDVMEALTGLREFTELRFSVPEYSRDRVKAAAATIERKLSKAGVRVNLIQIQDPDRHPAQETLDGIGLVLAVLAAASIFLSTFLVINTVSAVVAQQVPQIGVMKTIGGVRAQIAALYLSGVATYGLLSLALAVPLGAVGGYTVARVMLYYFNVPASPFEILPPALLLQIGLGLFSPLLAGLWPVLYAVSVSVREALAAYGVGTGRYGAGWLDRLMGRVHGLPPLAVLMLRNTFRRAGRVALTQITLTMAGTVFMMVVTAHASMVYTFQFLIAGYGFDLYVAFDDFQRTDEIAPLIAARPHVERVEMWAVTFARSSLPGATGPDSRHETLLYGIPNDTEFFSPRLLAGRSLDPGDGHALLFNQKLAKEMGLKVGDRVTLDLGDVGQSSWTIVGLILDPAGSGGGGNTAFAPREVVSVELNRVGRASAVEIRIRPNTLETQQAVERDLRRYLEARGIGVSQTISVEGLQQGFEGAITIVTTMLLMMAVLMAFVGSIGLSGTLSINVIERRREIGVMRAVGASSGDVALVFVGEGLLLGGLSFLPALPLSVVASRFLVKALGDAIAFPAMYRYSSIGALLWLGIVMAISLGASWLPAHRAAQISVRESLSYE